MVGVQAGLISHSYTYTVYARNITLSVDENVLASVRRYAAEQNSTVVLRKSRKTEATCAP